MRIRKLLKFGFILVATALVGVIVLAKFYLLRGDEISVPAAQAYKDGFEVVVITRDMQGKALKAESIALSRALALTAPSRTLLLSQDASTVEKLLLAGESGQSRLKTIGLKSTGGLPQNVEVHFSYSNRSSTFAYSTDGHTVWPKWREESDLGGRLRTIYTSN
jgi:hypothetical protein